MRFGPGAERETGRINREEDRDVSVRSQIVAPFVPFVGSGFEGCGQAPDRWLSAIFDAQDG
jgi:hypothetical protein